MAEVLTHTLGGSVSCNIDVPAGMPPLFAIQAATVHASELLKHDKDLGSVTAGKFADVVAVAGNPLDNISLLKQVSFVMKEGVVYKRDGKALEY